MTTSQLKPWLYPSHMEFMTEKWNWGRICSVFLCNYHSMNATYYIIRDPTVGPFGTRHISTSNGRIKYYQLVYTILRTCSLWLGGEYNKCLRIRCWRKRVELRKMKKWKVQDTIYEKICIGHLVSFWWQKAGNTESLKVKTRSLSLILVIKQ
jgi:hypothetical protein